MSVKEEGAAQRSQVGCPSGVVHATDELLRVPCVLLGGMHCGAGGATHTGPCRCACLQTGLQGGGTAGQRGKVP